MRSATYGGTRSRTTSPTSAAVTIRTSANPSNSTKGVEFGPWLARFIAQVRINWMIPQAAMSMHGHVAISLVVHKDGRITDVIVAKPSLVNAFTLSGRNAILTSNPTIPLPARVSGRPDADPDHVLLQRVSARPMIWPTRTQQIGLALVLAMLVAGGSAARAHAVTPPRLSLKNPTSWRSSGRPPPARARLVSRSRRGLVGKSSAAIRPPSIAASTSAPTKCRWRIVAACRTT